MPDYQSSEMIKLRIASAYNAYRPHSVSYSVNQFFNWPPVLTDTKITAQMDLLHEQLNYITELGWLVLRS